MLSNLMRIHAKSDEKPRTFRRLVLLAAAVALLFAPQLGAQANSSASIIPAVGSENHYTWIEEFEGSSNAEGQVMLFDSSAGYVFGRHVSVDGGIPVYFVRANTTSATGTSTTNSFTALGDIYGQFRLSFPNPMLNFRTQSDGPRTHE